MRTKNKPILKILGILAGMALLVGCSPFFGKKCEIDGDCGGDFCSENSRKTISSTCVDGRCQDISTECAETEICVADSRGVRCLPKDPITNKAILSCGNNTTMPGFIPFNPAGYVCGDDCPADQYCNPDCICVLREKRSCSDNTDNVEVFGINIFDPTTEMCKDDCPFGFDCINDCVCEEYDCPDPVFTTNYWGDAPPVDASFDDLMDLWLEEMLFDHIGNMVNITAFDHVRDGENYIIPFPEVQLSLVPNPDNKLITEPGWGGYCVNDYYDGDEAMDIDYEWLSRPIQSCVWGGTTGFEGVLTVCTEILIDWFEAYTE